MLYLSSPEIRDYSLQLRYKIENQSWTKVPGALVSSSMLRGDEDGDEWSTFSIQTSLDGILLNRDDSIEFEWVVTATSADVDAEDIPVAFQQIGFFPDVFSPESIDRGDLIVSEILPSTNVRGESVEFIEVYNPTENLKNLKGLEIRTQTGSHTIRSDFQIGPHSLAVMMSGDSPQELTTDQVYKYSGSILSENAGYIELHLGEKELAKATFERGDEDRSLELDQIANAFDGYSSLQHFRPSNTSFEGSVSATPGSEGNTQKLYSKEIDVPGWHFIAPPGLLDMRMSRLNPQQIQSLKVDQNLSTELEVNEPFFVFFESERERKIYSNQTAQTGLKQGFPISGSAAKVFTAPGDRPFILNNLKDEQGRTTSPAYLYWNSSNQRFQLLYNDEAEVSRWTPLIAHESAELPSERSSETGAVQQGVRLDRMLSFRLFEIIQDGSKQELDQSIVGFLREERGQTDKSFDLPKLLPVSVEKRVPDDLNMLHITSAAAANRANSFIHFQYELDQEYEFGLGVTSTDRTYQAVLDWSEMEDIPDEWILTLKDNLTGREIDMKEQSDYEFRLNVADNGLNGKEVEPGTIVPFNPEDEERFTVSMKPFESAIGMSEKDERPGSIELRQNYPNPFNPSTNIEFYLPEQQPVRIGVYNIVGQQVALLADESYGAGEHVISWNASEMPSGVYIVQLEVGSRIFTRKITLIK
ncbi:T9SS type A sorting domain-containing protein [Rhodohalobacter sp.]|uniref:T9SS type A sorting domain-containing protein n=1 Tax=Rhodohalobacter sp. TaxID=1974210 RepID=UPI002ACEC59E|nr:T9SS type A sorting domain-containing protein [Rhodohalobacter sp.]MDZ7755966.1 T9SS type A sorting domain-containing protein [Rhodohalobacter sp.]